MKRKKNKFSGKICYTFARISTLTGYIIGLLAVFSLSVNQDPQGGELVPLAKLFFEAAKITMELEKSNQKSDQPPNQK